MPLKHRNGTNGVQPRKAQASKPGTSSGLENELRFFEKNRKKWLALHENEFAVISGQTLAGFFPDFASAWKAGFHEFGPRKPFLIKEVLAVDPVYITF